MESVLKRISPNCKIITVPNENRRGPVDAVLRISEHIKNNEIIVSYCDYGTVWDYNGFLEHTRNLNSDGAIACYT